MNKRNYWKELSLILIGGIIGYCSPKASTQPIIFQKTILDKDTIIDTVYISKKLSKENLREELIKQQVPCANIVFHQAMLETGNLTSVLCRKKNNLFGIRYKNRYKSYTTWQDCVTDYKKRISNKYSGGDYYVFLRKIKYAEDPAYINKLKKMA